MMWLGSAVAEGINFGLPSTDNSKDSLNLNQLPSQKSPGTSVKAQPDAEDIAAAKRMLRAVNMPKIIQAGLDAGINNVAVDPAEKALFVRWITQKTAGDFWLNRLAPLYAKKMTRAEMIAQSRFAESPAGQKMYQWILDSTVQILQGSKPKLTLSKYDTQEIERWLKQPDIDHAFQTFNQVNSTIWGEPRLAALKQEFRAEFIQYLKVRIAPLVQVNMQTRARFELQIRKIEDKLQHMDFTNALTPEGLLSASHIKKQLAELSEYDQLLSQYVTFLEQAQHELSEKQYALLKDMPDEDSRLLLGLVDRGAEIGYSTTLRQGENLKKVSMLLRKILMLAESNLGQIHYEGGKMVFSDTNVLATYVGLLDELDRENKITESLKEEWQKIEAQRANALSAMSLSE